MQSFIYSTLNTHFLSDFYVSEPNRPSSLVSESLCSSEGRQSKQINKELYKVASYGDKCQGGK